MHPFIGPGQSVGVVNIVVVIVATITIATMAASPVSDNASAFDRIALLRWKLTGQGVSFLVTALGIAIAVSLVSRDPQTAGWMLLAVTVVGVLASVTVIGARDRQRAGLETVEKRVATKALKRLGNERNIPASREPAKPKGWRQLSKKEQPLEKFRGFWAPTRRRIYLWWAAFGFGNTTAQTLVLFVLGTNSFDVQEAAVAQLAFLAFTLFLTVLMVWYAEALFFLAALQIWWYARARKWRQVSRMAVAAFVVFTLITAGLGVALALSTSSQGYPFVEQLLFAELIMLWFPCALAVSWARSSQVGVVAALGWRLHRNLVQKAKRASEALDRVERLGQ